MKRGICLAIFFVLFVSVVCAMNSSNYNITSVVVSDGGTNITSSNYKTDLTIGQIAGNSSSASYKNFFGFWYGIARADTTPPYFVDIANQTLIKGQSLSYDINATDETGFDSFAIDDTTNFTINISSGVITNITGLSIGIYVVNITINDTSNNLNSTLWSLNVANSYPQINFTSPTPDNASSQNNSDIYVNYTVSDADNDDLYSFINFDNSLVGWWRMDNDSSVGENDTLVYDWSGNGNNGTFVYNGTGGLNSSGRFGGAAGFDGDYDEINLDGYEGFNFSGTNEFTISAWIYPNLTGGNTIFSRGAVGSSPVNTVYYISRYSNDRLQAEVSDGTTNIQIISSVGTLSLGEWQHVTLVWNGSLLNLYKNGSSIATAENVSFTSLWDGTVAKSRETSIGAEGSDEELYFDGLIDEVMVFNRSLSDEEVVALYNATSTYHNFTSQSAGNHTFTAYSIDEDGALNYTETREVEITDFVAPTINITTPQNNSIITDIYQDVNYTYVEENPDTCWYSNDTYSENITLASCGTNITSVVWTEGNHNVTIWINDTSGYENSSYVNFTVANSYPQINFTSPTPDNASSQNNSDIYVNYTVSDADNDDLYSFINFDNSLVGWWRMDNDSSVGENDTLVYDWSGNGNNGTFILNNGTSSFNSSGAFSGAWSFDGDGDYINAGTLGDFGAHDGKDQMKNGTTISVWIKYTSTEIMDILGNFNTASSYIRFSANQGPYGIVEDSYYFQWRQTSNFGTQMKFDADVNDGNWHHIVVGAIPAGAQEAWVDGNPVNIILYDNDFSEYQSWQISSYGLGIGGYIEGESVINYFNGSMDELIIFNRVLSDEEVVALYNATSTYHNFTSQSAGNHTFTAYSVDEDGALNYTEERVIGITNNAPNNPTPILVSTDGTNQTASDLNCSSLITDDDLGDLLNATVLWFKEDVLNFTVDYNNSYANATMFSAILDSGNTTKTDNWTCSMRLFDGIEYSTWVNSSDLEILNTLPNVALIDPVNNNVTTNRTQLFTWSGSDDDNDALTYQINISLHDTGSPGSPCSDPDRDDSGISNEYYMPTSYMICLQDNNYYYNWTVRVSDDSGVTYGDWATEWRVDFQSEVLITLINDTVSFGTISQDGIDNTTDDNPYPFVVENIGNCFLNITINATDLWNTISNPTNYFQYKVDNYTGEEGSFNWAQSQTSWSQVPNSTQEMAIVRIDWDDSTDSAEVDLLIEVPSNEGSGSRESTMNFEASLGE